MNGPIILSAVSDPASTPPSPTPTTPTPASLPEAAASPAEFRFPPEFFFALSHPVRVWIAQRLSRGVEKTATQVANEWKRKFFTMNTHCKTLRDAGVIASHPGEDRRSEVYFIPEQIRREPGWLDYGWCRFRVL